jgi:hypothetical protein
MADWHADERKDLRWRLELLAFEARLAGVPAAGLAPPWDLIDRLGGYEQRVIMTSQMNPQLRGVRHTR